MKNLIILCSFLAFVNVALAELKPGDKAPLFSVLTQEGKTFKLADRKGLWTVLYFYPKAETPGCTKQACSFRDNIKKITSLKAEVFGISTNNVQEQADFAKNHNLNFTLLADDSLNVTKLYDAKMAVVNFSKRWTFIIDPDLVIKDVSRDVDPVKDAERVATVLAKLQSERK